MMIWKMTFKRDGIAKIKSFRTMNAMLNWEISQRGKITDVMYL